MKFLLALALTAGLGTAWAGDAERAAAAARANNEFGIRLFQTVEKRTAKGNKFLSPISAYVALSMALNGASGETLAQMERTLALQNLSREDLNSANAALLASLNSRGNELELRLANSLWARQGFGLRAAYVDRVKKHYDAQLAELDFNLPIASKTINDWVSGLTKGRIPTIVEERLDPSLVLLLVNATYFKAKWQMPFKAHATRMMPFGPKATPLPTMAQEGSFKYLNLEAEGAEVLELPYGKNATASMIVVLPNRGRSHLELEKRATVEQWDALAAQLAEAKPLRGQVVLPKVEFSYDEVLNGALQSLGMQKAFTGAAEFSELTAESVRISKVLQKTFIGVNEEGTEAAAVTGISIEKTSAPLQQFRFVVDRPYLFAIRDNETGAILFLGSITEPEGGKMPPKPKAD